MSQQINIVQSSAVPLNIENVDTDQIIPARFLKATSREGFGKNLFRDWRYENDDEQRPRPEFPLNNPTFSGSILITAKNFGCGSSREHAAWAIKDAGFNVVVSSFFADIFRNNCLNNFLLPVTVSEKFLQSIFDAIEKNPATQFEVNLPEQYIRIIDGDKTMAESFQISNYKKTCLVNGYDDIDFLLSIKDDIAQYEKEKAF